MINVYITIVKHLLILIAGIYTFFSFYSINKKENVYNILQKTNVLIIHFLANSILYLEHLEDKYILFYGAQLMFFVVFFVVFRAFYKNINSALLNNISFLLTISFVIMTRLSFERAIRQFVIAFFALFLMMIVPFVFVKIKKLKENLPFLTYLYSIVGLFLLILVYLLGKVVYGAKISLSIGGFSFQPFEFVKILYVFFLANTLAKLKYSNKLNIFNKDLIISALIAGLHVIILVLSKDLGTALILFITYVFLIYNATSKKLLLAIGLFLFSLASYMSYLIFDHVKVRVDVWLDPFSDIAGKGYQLTQSLFAIGTGGFFGMGLGKGTPKKIPVVYEDFIFSAISEELGSVFGVFLILICLSTFIIILRVAINEKDYANKYICVGIATIYIFQTFLTIGGAIKFIPSTGVTLPFISYGGTSLIASFISIGVINAISISQSYEKNEKHKTRTTKKSININQSIVATIYSFGAVFIMMSVFLSYFVQYKAPVIINNPYNSRQDIFAEYVKRGKIYSRDYKVLAMTLAENNNEIRKYPYNNLFSHVVGINDFGKTGIESYYNFELLSSNTGYLERFYNELNGKKSEGNNVITTFDIGLQQLASDVLGEHKGSIIITNPLNGEILAMLSKPDFNPNTINETYEDIISDKNDTSMLNRSTQGLYTPGSVFKIFTLAEFINQNNNYNDYSYNCTSVIQNENYKISCHNHATHGKVDLIKSIAFSCNTSFVNLGLSLDLERFRKNNYSLLFNKNLELDFTVEKSQFLLDSNSTEFEIAQTVIGQGKTLVTPMHMAMITNALANKGKLMKPHYISSIESYLGDTIKNYKPIEYDILFNLEDAEFINKALRQAVVSGTARVLNSELYTAYGKTGTAQTDESLRTNSWFTGYSNLKDDINNTIAITIVIEDLQNDNIKAVNLAKQIFDKYFTNKVY